MNAWADGTGKLITSDQPGFAYMATVQEEIVWSRVPSNKINGEQRFHDTARITWNCQPFMYQAVDTVIILTESQGLVNPGSAEAFPLVEVSGSGDVSFSVNGNTITITGMTVDVPVTIDSENGYVYTPSGASEITGEFPVFGLGNVIGLIKICCLFSRKLNVHASYRVNYLFKIIKSYETVAVRCDTEILFNGLIKERHTA